MSPRARDALVFAALLAAAVILARVAPSERVLGGAVRIVYLHGAFVWSALLAFLGAALAGLGGWILRRPAWHAWSIGLGRSATLFWWMSMALSLAAMQTSWNGLYLAEPRWQLAVRFGLVAVMLQAAIVLVRRPALGSLLNIVFVAALILSLARTPTVLHPVSPIFTSESMTIRAHFLLLSAVVLAAVVWLGRAVRPRA